MAQPSFLSDFQLRPVPLPSSSPFQQVGLALGKGASALEVLVTASGKEPSLQKVRSLWRERNNKRAAPLLVIVLHDGKATVCGPAGDDPPAYAGVDPGQAERICHEALEQPDRHAALRFLRDALPAVVDTRLPGLRNEGFLATHELAVGARRLEAWADADRKARPALPQRGEALLHALGFKIERCDQVTSILRAGPNGNKLAVAVLLHQSESPELEAERFNGLSPVSYAMSVADRENLPYVVVSQGARMRLYPVRIGVGVGRRGRTETYLEIHTGLLPDRDAAYLWMLFSAEALAEGGSLDQLMRESKRFAGNLAERLRERVYGEVVPGLARGLAEARGLKKPTAKDLAETYEMAMTVLFRLLFIAYAEDKDLLPYRWNGLYRHRSLKTKAQELVDRFPQGIIFGEEHLPFDQGTSYWEEVGGLFRAVEEGNRDWGVPAYDGGLFSRDPEVSRVGKLLAEVSLPNTVMGPVLWHLLVIETREGWGPVDFRSLSVREFGTIYEGLLESELSVAEVNLMVDDKGFYRPCLAGEEPLVKKNHIYLHNRSGARKATGTYFTKEFAVEHLLDHALEPALKEHLARLDALDDDTAGERFFDFRVADIAMGSGHFLVAAVDRIERGLTQYLAKRSLPKVRSELARLRASAEEALGPLADQVEIEDTQLLRRLIARRCIYGVDLNPVAVNLARLSIWIHTFVAGLPLSLLDHNLVPGNSLVGIGQLSEIADKAMEDNVAPDDKDQPMLFAIGAETLLGAALEPLSRLAQIADANAAEVKRARRAMIEARAAVRPAEALCDITVAARTRGTALSVELGDWESIKESLPDSPAHRTALKSNQGLQVFHFPIAFPEVFLRKRPGFDVLIGNPPWDKVRFEPQQFWVTRSPGLNSLPANRRDAAIEELRRSRPTDAHLEQEDMELRERLQKIVDRAFRLQGRGRHGHHDFAKVFCERAMNLLAASASLGYVVPRTALVLGGWTDIRQVLLDARVTALQARNKGGWLFDDVDNRIMVCLMTRQRGPEADQQLGVWIWPAVISDEQLGAANRENALYLGMDELASLSDSWVIPWFSDAGDRPLFDRLRTFPRLGSGAGWISALPDSSRWDFSGSGPHQAFVESDDPGRGWRVLMTRHVEAYRIARTVEFQRFIPKPEKLVGLDLGVILKNRRPVIGPDHPVLVFRYPSRNDDTRTLIATALDEEGFLYSKGYVHGLRTGTAPIQDMLALLGYLNSFVCDWWVRRFTDRHVTLPVLKNIPLPDWTETDRAAVAGVVSTLLARGGTKRLPGGAAVTADATHADLDDVDLKAAVESHVLRGFRLTHADLRTVLTDFSEAACPQGFLDKVRAEMG